MKLIKSESTLDLSTQVQLPTDLIKGLYIRFSGTAATGVTPTIAQLGTVRVNYRGQDIVNAPFSFLSLYNNMKKGVAEFSAASGGAVVGSVYVPFHMSWDENSGIPVQDSDSATVTLNFSALVAAVMATGSVEIYYIPAKTTSKYVPILLNQNIQVGGAGQVTQRLRNFNISSIYYVENSHVTGQILVNKDGENRINTNQAAAKAYSNLQNEVETAITLIELDLNPNKLLSNALSIAIDLYFGMDAATTIELYTESIMYLEAVGSSGVSPSLPTYTKATTAANSPLVAVTTKPAPLSTQ